MMVKFQDGTSHTGSWNQLAEAKKIIAELQKENAELKALNNNQQTPGIWNFRTMQYNLFKNYFLGRGNTKWS